MRRRIALFLALMLLILAWPSLLPVLADDTIEVRVYYSPTCSHCHTFIDEYLPGIVADAQAPIDVVLVDVSSTEGLTELEAQEERLDQKSPSVPTVIIGDQMLYSTTTIAALDEAVRAAISSAAINTSSDTLDPLGLVPTATTQPYDGAPLHVAYIERDGCSDCARAKLVLDALAFEFPGMEVTTFNHVDDAAIVEAMGEAMGLAEDRRLIAPSIYVGSDAIIADEITSENVRAVLSQYVSSGAPAFWEKLDSEAGGSSIVERFEEIGPLAIIGAGLIDGINPCAFATILFFVSYLAIGKRKRREMLFVGLAFALGVFVAYFLVGLGLMNLLSLATSIHIVASILYGLMAAACIVMAVLSIRDYVLARQGYLHDMQMTLPDKLRERIRLRIRDSSKAFVGAAFVTGLVVSLLELACTGQVYLPTISFVVSLDSMRTRGVLYLLLYNLAFILPLLIVLLMAVYGLSIKKLQSWFTEHVAATKLAMAILFIVLGGLLVAQLIALL